MIRYLIVDCDDPDPNFSAEKKGKVERMAKRVALTLLRYMAGAEDLASDINVVVGVTRGDVSSSEIGVRVAMERINHMKSKRVFNKLSILNSETCHIQAGLDSPPDIEGELHILSNRISTRRLFKDKNCWWNSLSDLKKSVNNIGKKKKRHRRSCSHDACLHS